MDDATINRVLYALLAIVIFLFYGELRRAWEMRQQALWDDRYIDAVRSSEEEWRFGWRLEDLESRLHAQRYWAEALIDAAGAAEAASAGRGDGAIRTAVADALAAAESDVANFVTVSCGSRPGKAVHVGPDEFRDMGDACRVFSGLDVADARDVGPQSVFEIVSLDGEGDAVGLRSLSNGRFARVKAPATNAEWNAPWNLEFASPAAGLAERFQLRPMPRPETAEVSAEVPAEEAPAADAAEWEKPYGDDFYGGDVASGGRTAEPAFAWAPTYVSLYSELMRGYLQCSGGGVSEPVRGFAGETVDAAAAEYNFNFTVASPEVLRRARTLLASSDHIVATRRVADAARRAAALADRSRIAGVAVTTPNKPPPKATPSAYEGRLRVAVVVPMTSRGTDMDGVEQSPLWFNLFASFLESVDWRANRHDFHFYLGFDQGDALYDTGDAWSETRSAFDGHARKALKWLGYGNWTVKRVLEADPSIPKSRPKLDLKLVHFPDTAGAPSRAVSKMARLAVADGADYVYQLNDDTILVSKDWLRTYVEALENSPLAPNLGVAGPLDTTNERILTHAFVHRTHVNIFDGFFPTAFRNWWSDDWISVVYGKDATFARKDVVVTHNVQSQKTGAWNRYDVDHAAQHQLHDQVQRGFVKINAWLRDAGYPTMPLPNVCGYSPVLTRVHDALLRHGLR